MTISTEILKKKEYLYLNETSDEADDDQDEERVHSVFLCRNSLKNYSSCRMSTPMRVRLETWRSSAKSDPFYTEKILRSQRHS